MPERSFLYRLAAAAYRIAWKAAGPAALLPGSRGKTARSLRGRLGAASALEAWAAGHREAHRPLAWFHAASVGEGRQAESVVRRLRQARPAWQIAYTFASASAEQFAATIPADVHGYLPADTPSAAGRALDALRPAALVFSATDLWPELVRQAAIRGVRLGLISATLAPGSSRRGAVARALLGPAYRALDSVGAIDTADADGLVALGVRRESVVVTGDTRHDAAAERVARLDRDAPLLAALRAVSPILVAGSTWEADERELLPAVAQATARAPLRLVIAPHEPTPRHLGALRRRLARAMPGAAVLTLAALEGLVLRYGRKAGEVRPWPAAADLPPWDVCMVDRTGVLAELYAAATVAYVGGGFHSAGLHSVIEPAALGVPVLFGPRWRSSRDARLLLEAGGAVSAADRRGLAAALGAWLEGDAARAAAASARRVADRGLGAADRSVRLVEALVEDHTDA